ncbi:hypothetical protein BCR44DRAFT_71662 [Catenaria anguillulae PL171]|uniref:SH3 domain-containing protein n=1 Tax=Catenaria anguillulae PL171 TaxID=765915 RepID=A0A1Y2HQI3_9FUNG|nr:hypothetical protein BCR44DRAFT_71662 [Catenaria anguillulae PL171]
MESHYHYQHSHYPTIISPNRPRWPAPSSKSSYCPAHLSAHVYPAPTAPPGEAKFTQQVAQAPHFLFTAVAAPPHECTRSRHNAKAVCTLQAESIPIHHQVPPSYRPRPRYPSTSSTSSSGSNSSTYSTSPTHSGYGPTVRLPYYSLVLSQYPAHVAGARIAVGKHVPRTPLELAVSPGDLVHVLSADADGWAVGRIEEMGNACGKFPLWILEPRDDEDVVVKAISADIADATLVSRS